jgi:beta-lactamase superfamily II metal-dependent hydrolase
MVAFLKATVPNLTTLDHMILSHPHRDHVELLPDVLAQYQVRQVWDAGRFYDNCGYRLFLEAVRDEPSVQYHTGMQDMGTRDYAFPQETCYNNPVVAETIHVPHSTRMSVGDPVPLGQGASMTFLRADGAKYANPNDNSLVVRLDLGDTRVLLVGDSEAGGREDPSVPPTASSPEGLLLACCRQALAADVLIEAHHGSKTSSREAFLDAVMASIYVVSSGPTKYGQVVLPDVEVTNELSARGQLFRTDLNDTACKTSTTKIGPKTDGKAGGCDNVRVTIPPVGALQVAYFHGG